MKTVRAGGPRQPPAASGRPAGSAARAGAVVVLRRTTLFDTQQRQVEIAVGIEGGPGNRGHISAAQVKSNQCVNTTAVGRAFSRRNELCGLHRHQRQGKRADAFDLDQWKMQCALANRKKSPGVCTICRTAASAALIESIIGSLMSDSVHSVVRLTPDRRYRIQLSLNGEVVRRTLKRDGVALPPSSENLDEAKRLTAEIRSRIAAGTFCHSEYFPATRKDGRPLTVGEHLDAWLAVQRIEPSTAAAYASAVRVWKSAPCDDQGALPRRAGAAPIEGQSRLARVDLPARPQREDRQQPRHRASPCHGHGRCGPCPRRQPRPTCPLPAAADTASGSVHARRGGGHHRLHDRAVPRWGGELRGVQVLQRAAPIGDNGAALGRCGSGARPGPCASGHRSGAREEHNQDQHCTPRAAEPPRTRCNAATVRIGTIGGRFRLPRSTLRQAVDRRSACC